MEHCCFLNSTSCLAQFCHISSSAWWDESPSGIQGWSHKHREWLLQPFTCFEDASHKQFKTLGTGTRQINWEKKNPIWRDSEDTSLYSSIARQESRSWAVQLLQGSDVEPWPPTTVLVGSEGRRQQQPLVAGALPPAHACFCFCVPSAHSPARTALTGLLWLLLGCCWYL